jgi:multicomponent Na+:H+ antiporter subunit D
MPFTMGAFFVASMSIIGMPPLGGSWSKWYLMLGALDGGRPWVVAALLVSSLLSVGYLLSIVGRAFFRPPAGADAEHGSPVGHEAPLLCVVPLCVTAALCVILFAGGGTIERLLASALDPGLAHQGALRCVK